MYVLNDGLEEVSWEKGTLICAFGKGKFKSKQSIDDELEMGEIPYMLQESVPAYAITYTKNRYKSRVHLEKAHASPP